MIARGLVTETIPRTAVLIWLNAPSL